MYVPNVIPHWLVQNWHASFGSPWREIGLSLAALICGAIVGSERQEREKPAGMRTLILVTLGSAVFTMLSFVFNTSTGDSGRVVAQIVTGIGFLGAGVIMRSHGTISGTTTAATIWVGAAIGMTVGAGYPVAGAGLSILVRGVLTGIYLLETKSLSKISPCSIAIDFNPEHGKTRVRIERILVYAAIALNEVQWSRLEDGSGLERLNMELRMQRHHLRDMLDEISAIPAVKVVAGLSSAPK